MDAIPEKAYYVPLPRLPHLQMPDLPRVRLPQVPRLSVRDLIAVIRRHLRDRHTGRTVPETPLDPIPEKYYYLPLPRLPRLRGGELPLSAVLARTLAGRHRARSWAWHTPDAKVVERWWVSHAPDAAFWMLTLASAVVVGVLIARF